MNILKLVTKHTIQKTLQFFGLTIVRKHEIEPFYIFKYDGGYDEYRKTQIMHNKKKLQKVFADQNTLNTIKNFLKNTFGDKQIYGICHGARNGYEVNWFNENTSAKVIGTDISETAKQFDNMVVWDFHEVNEKWSNYFDFVYTNSLDQAMDPKRALETWSKQIKAGGLIFIEHTMQHSPTYANAMDPFGAHPMCMPYLFFEWGMGVYRLFEILHIEKKSNSNQRAWLFVLEKGGKYT